MIGRFGSEMIPPPHSCRSGGLGLKRFRIDCFVPDVVGGLSHCCLSIEGTFSAYWVSPSIHVAERSWAKGDSKPVSESDVLQ